MKLTALYTSSMPMSFERQIDRASLMHKGQNIGILVNDYDRGLEILNTLRSEINRNNSSICTMRPGLHLTRGTTSIYPIYHTNTIEGRNFVEIFIDPSWKFDTALFLAVLPRLRENVFITHDKSKIKLPIEPGRYYFTNDGNKVKTGYNQGDIIEILTPGYEYYMESVDVNTGYSVTEGSRMQLLEGPFGA